MEQTSFDFADITANRHKGSPTSVAANKKASTTKTAWRYLVFDFIRNRGTATLEDLCKHFGKEKNQLSGRCSELQALEMIEKTGRVINGFAEYRQKSSAT